MSDRKQITEYLSQCLVNQFDEKQDQRVYLSREVTFDYQTENKKRVDFVRFVPVNNSVSGIEKGDFSCYEVKSSVEDFHSPNGHNFLGDYNYYVMPEDAFDKVKKEIPFDIGVYIPSDFSQKLQCVKPARRKNRTRPVAEFLLMMYRSALREVKKNNKEQKCDKQE